MEAFWVPRASPGDLLPSFGGALGDFLASSDVLLAAVGYLGGPLGVLWVSKGAPGSLLGASGPISGIFREIPGALLASILLLFASFFGYFSEAGAFVGSRFVNFQISREMLQPTKLL